MEDAANILGARTLRTTLRITLPLVTPAIIGGIIISFLEAIALFGAPALIALPARFNVVSTQLWQFFEYPVRVEEAAAYSMPLLAITVLMFWLQRRILGRCLGRHVLDGAPEVVADGEHVAGEVGDRIAGRVGPFPLGAAAQILHVGKGSEQPIAHIGVLDDQGFELYARLPGRIVAIALAVGTRSLVGIGARSGRVARIGLVVGHRRLCRMA